MEEKYIEKENALHRLRELLELVMISEKTDYNNGAADALTSAIKVVEDVSAADVRQVVHSHFDCVNDDENVYMCLNCGDEFILECGTPKEHGYNYCPFCGAYMKKGK